LLGEPTRAVLRNLVCSGIRGAYHIVPLQSLRQRYRKGPGEVVVASTRCAEGGSVGREHARRRTVGGGDYSERLERMSHLVVSQAVVAGPAFLFHREHPASGELRQMKTGRCR